MTSQKGHSCDTWGRSFSAGTLGHSLSRIWCKGDRLLCTNLVHMHLSPLHQFGKWSFGDGGDGSFRTAMAPSEAASPKTMPIYYDGSGIPDHNGIFLKIASCLPAVLLEHNSLWLEVGG